ncbi:zinc finger (c3hc4 ring finger) domain-containing protein [Cyclospora cayetanensis]|uniref:Zinc finger (C3hc4 ring finger) domain-containing protein n=1 Tax=Cyclospora cayetanensis TaxID=88456 RepID=A0A1D3D727_9EIME|nr:zinc finger (c3hc4 ring finger) domain-containing protein [Cyclospora cayetanensis]
MAEARGSASGGSSKEALLETLSRDVTTVCKKQRKASLRLELTLDALVDALEAPASAVLTALTSLDAWISALDLKGVIEAAQEKPFLSLARLIKKAGTAFPGDPTAAAAFLPPLQQHFVPLLVQQPQQEDQPSKPAKTASFLHGQGAADGQRQTTPPQKREGQREQQKADGADADAAAAARGSGTTVRGSQLIIVKLLALHFLHEGHFRLYDLLWLRQQRGSASSTFAALRSGVSLQEDPCRIDMRQQLFVAVPLMSAVVTLLHPHPSSPPSLHEDHGQGCQQSTPCGLPVLASFFAGGLFPLRRLQSCCMRSKRHRRCSVIAGMWLCIRRVAPLPTP